ncbi:MAG: type II toxin-antitoxin system prevent-host-death family antitoxin [Anaerolineae bacterium]|nr:type II toxin-antitoxin system prevent-host-death family antitoxin [Anaerolineae bacterium]MDK1080713.1 type II toxin-antitoxin system prevent-host-death family antitoxin [Anaerolineae bacterium]MDK1119559.1 type II toxin-antitoxin system prevent-host-death family antitoxin [Anaerolineae bacterium]
MTSFNIHGAKPHFSNLLERVLSAEEIEINKAGRPIAGLLPFDEACSAARVPGVDKWV